MNLKLLLLLNVSWCVRIIQVQGGTQLGYYYIDSYIGNPPQKKGLIIDTGSQLMIIPKRGCEQCNPHQNGLFDERKSKTIKTLRSNKRYLGWKCRAEPRDDLCEFEVMYDEGSRYSGYYVEDQVLFENELQTENPDQFRQIFGLATVETGMFLTQRVDGIVGLGLSSPHQPPNPFQTKLFRNKDARLIFSMCLAHGGGYMTIGDEGAETSRGNDIKWIGCPHNDWNKKYSVDLQQIKIDGVQVEFDYSSLNHRRN